VEAVTTKPIHNFLGIFFQAQRTQQGHGPAMTFGRGHWENIFGFLSFSPLVFAFVSSNLV
jgi:hypothetical protein